MDRTRRAMPNIPKSLGERSLARMIILINLKRLSAILKAKTQNVPLAVFPERLSPADVDLLIKSLIFFIFFMFLLWTYYNIQIDFTLVIAPAVITIIIISIGPAEMDPYLET